MIFGLKFIPTLICKTLEAAFVLDLSDDFSATGLSPEIETHPTKEVAVKDLLAPGSRQFLKS